MHYGDDGERQPVLDHRDAFIEEETRDIATMCFIRLSPLGILTK
jgi:hypothetical protein